MIPKFMCFSYMRAELQRHLLVKISQVVFITWLSSLLSSCLFVCLTGPSPLEQPLPPKMPIKKQCPTARVYTIRGFLDVFSTGMFSLAEQINQQLAIPARSISHVEEKRLSSFLIQEYQKGCKAPIVLIGHSYGADDQIKVAKRLNAAHIPVALLISLDHTKQQTIPPNVRAFYNISSGKSIVHAVIPWGCPMKIASSKTKMVYIDLVQDQHLKWVNHFNIDKLTPVHQLIIQIIWTELFHDKDCKAVVLSK